MKHFTVNEGDLYIFTTGLDQLHDLDMFPGELNLFEAESAWRISPWVAIVEDVHSFQLERAQIILQLHGYEKTTVPTWALDSYFVDGDENKLMEVLLKGVSVPA